MQHSEDQVSLTFAFYSHALSTRHSKVSIDIVIRAHVIESVQPTLRKATSRRSTARDSCLHLSAMHELAIYEKKETPYSCRKNVLRDLRQFQIIFMLVAEIFNFYYSTSEIYRRFSVVSTKEGRRGKRKTKKRKSWNEIAYEFCL